MSSQIVIGNCMDVLPTLPEKSVQSCITSPPYWGLRDYGVDDQLGLERVHDCLGWATGNPCDECYVCHTVAWAREVRRVLRDDGTLWVVIGDSYCGYKGTNYGINPQLSHLQKNSKIPTSHMIGTPQASGLKPKDLVGIPWRVALALQADGWWLRSDVIWAKPNPMPESVRDRPTKAHEYIFLFSKNARYYWDAEAVKEPAVTDHLPGSGHTFTDTRKNHGTGGGNSGIPDLLDKYRSEGLPTTRNIRTVWTVATHPYPEAHFATYPPALVETMIKASTSEYGCCPKCGKAWERVIVPTGHVNKRELAHCPNNSDTKTDSTGWAPTTQANGQWRPGCTCDAGEPIPCTILDPFIGAGTTGLVADRLGRAFVGIELNPEYVEMAERRIRADAPLLVEMG